MVIRRRLFAMMAAMGIGSLLVLLLFWLLLNRNVDGIMADRNESDHDTFERIIGLEGQVMKGLAFDYTYWTEMVDFAASGDETWAEQNLDAALDSFQCDACWVFKADYSLVTCRNAEDVVLDATALEVATLKSLFAEQKFPHWFARVGDVIVEFRGGPIQPTGDTERVTPAQGYFIVAREWRDDHLEEMQDLFGASSVRILDGVDEMEDHEHGDVGCSSHIYELPVVQGNPPFRLEAERCSPAIANLIQMNGFASVAVSIMLVLIVALFAIGLTLWVSVPITLMSDALAQRNSSLVAPLVSQKNEIGRLARLIVSFFRQQTLLEKEVMHRKEIQKKQDKLSVILRIWGRCNFAMAACASEKEMLGRWGMLHGRGALHLSRPCRFTAMTAAFLTL